MNEDKIMKELESLYEIKDPSKEDIYGVLVKNGMKSEDANNINFVYNFQEKIRELNEMQYSKGGIHEKEKGATEKLRFYQTTRVLPKQEDKIANENDKIGHSIKDWTIRYYTSQEVKVIQSNLQLSLENRKIISGHTNGEDWTKFGNVGNTFYCLYFQNRPVVIKHFLASCKCYAEFSLKDVDDLWISNDWISMENEKDAVFRGNGIAMFNHLTASKGRNMLSDQWLINNITSQRNTLEIKIPHSMRVETWKTVR